MTQNKGKQEEQKNNIHLLIVSIALSLLCFVFLFLYLVLTKKEFIVDNNVLLLLFAGIGILFLPFLSRLKILGVLEMERMHKEVKKVREVILRGQVVRDEHSRRFYIDKVGQRYFIPDDETATFLANFKGEMPLSTKDLEQYPYEGQIESVLSCKLLKWRIHFFAVLNARKYHIGSASYLADWNRRKDEMQSCDDQEIRKYPIGR